jgi:hypothetical protein
VPPRNLASIALVSAVFFACDAPPRATPAPAPSACAKFGEACEFSPGKLGTCVLKDDCVKDCLVCQSQH